MTTKTDRELLEMAAKAAGEEFVFVNGEKRIKDAGWNPLESDGQALRLAVKLGIQLGPNAASRDPMAFAWARERGGSPQYEPSAADPYAATRRAIVRAAAAIGEVMP